MFVLSREEMYSIDKFTIEKAGIPGQKLMENAGRGCSEFINDLITPKSRIALFCGSGNNGGDGFVIARYLQNSQHSPKIFLMGNIDKMSAETLSNYHKCKKLCIPIYRIEEKPNDLSEFDLIIDAIFGVGLKGEIKDWRIDVINKINSSGKTIVAIDIASGIDANTGQAKIAVKADFTLTMAAIKYGQLLGEGREKSGEVLVIDIGVPDNIFLEFPLKGKLATCDNIIFPYRSKFSHKGDYGRVGIIAGSPGFTGAAILASKAALRAGAGMITLFHPAGLETIFETQLLEVMTYALPKLPFDLSRRSETKTERGNKEGFFNKLNSMDVLLIGPGIGKSKETADLLKQIITSWNIPLILDADALNILADNKNIKKSISGKRVLLTPHIGEFARLCDVTIEDILKDPLQYLQDFTAKYKCNVLLKSATSIYCDGTEFIFDTTGNDGLSTGGSGDVLAGIITSFVGQQLSLKNAAVSASYLMGETVEKLAEIRKPASIIPSDIIENIFKY
ncbi:MAG: NAD(P)H-hydrate dehydratase [Candidatus Cloacimonadota bacterium]|nr:NAD(P)H-hydrate dehydratase [Candidatus Cloacimonadota bacterium]